MNNGYIIGLISGIAVFIGFYIYIKEIIQGKTKPNRVSWFVWTLVGLTLLISYYDANDIILHAIAVPVSYVVGPLIVAVMSIRYGLGGADAIDLTLLFLSIAGFACWWLLDSATTSLAINIIIDIFAALPTFIKAYKEPESESLKGWSWFLFGNLLNLLNIHIFSFEELAYPLYLFLMSVLLVFLIARPRFVSAR